MMKNSIPLNPCKTTPQTFPCAVDRSQHEGGSDETCLLFPEESGWRVKGNVSVAAQTWSLPESSSDAELKGRSEMAFSL